MLDVACNKKIVQIKRLKIRVITSISFIFYNILASVKLLKRVNKSSLVFTLEETEKQL